MKAHNQRIPKLSLLDPIAASKPGLRAFKDKRAFFLGHPVHTLIIQFVIEMQVLVFIILVFNMTALCYCHDVEAFFLGGGINDHFKLLQQPESRDFQEMSVCLRSNS